MMRDGMLKPDCLLPELCSRAHQGDLRMAVLLVVRLEHHQISLTKLPNMTVESRSIIIIIIISNLALLARDLGVERKRQHKEQRESPDDGAHDERVTTGAIADGTERVNDRQISVDAHQRHREDARVQVDAPEGVHEAAGGVAEHPASRVCAVGH